MYSSLKTYSKSEVNSTVQKGIENLFQKKQKNKKNKTKGKEKKSNDAGNLLMCHASTVK